MSFGRNIETIFGTDKYVGLADAPLKAVILADDSSRITFVLENGAEIAYGVEGDCCSHSWIEHLDVPPYVIGETLTGVEDGGGVPWDGHECVDRKYDDDYNVITEGCGHDSLQVYNTRFRTPKGDIVLEYRNDSNGYYGGYLVRL